MVEFASLDVFILSFFHGVFLELMQRVRSKNDRLEAVLWQNVPGTHDLAHGCADQVLGHCVALRVSTPSQNLTGTHDFAHGCADQVLSHCIALRVSTLSQSGLGPWKSILTSLALAERNLQNLRLCRDLLRSHPLYFVLQGGEHSEDQARESTEAGSQRKHRCAHTEARHRGEQETEHQGVHRVASWTFSLRGRVLSSFLLRPLRKLRKLQQTC